jgi:farnesyl diphosphate synthase
LDATGSVEQTGKQVRKDAAASKQTYPAAFGLDESRAQAGREIEAALQALAPFGSRADRLRELAQHMIERSA